MVESLNLTLLKNFFAEIFEIVKYSNSNLTEIWCEIADIKSIAKLNQYEIRDLLSYIDSISIKKGNYIDYIVVNKIKYITECLKYLTYDIKNLAELLDFGGFEALIQEILFQNNYKVIKNFRFSDKSSFKFVAAQKKYEIDLVAIYQKYVLLIDAKQWRRRDSYGAMNKAADLQLKRAIALKKNPEIFSNLIQSLLSSVSNIKRKLPFILVPVMVSLESNWIKINDNSIPLVSIENFNSFLQELRINLQYFKILKINNINIQKQLF